MTDYPDLCNNEPSCQKPELLKRIRELEEERYALMHQNSRDAHRIRELEAKLAECKPYLKRHETPAQCIQRNRDDAGRALKMLAEEKRRREEAHVVSPETIAAIKCVTGQNND